MVLVNKVQRKPETDCWILATETFSGNFDQNNRVVIIKAWLKGIEKWERKQMRRLSGDFLWSHKEKGNGSWRGIWGWEFGLYRQKKLQHANAVAKTVQQKGKAWWGRREGGEGQRFQTARGKEFGVQVKRLALDGARTSREYIGTGKEVDTVYKFV